MDSSALAVLILAVILAYLLGYKAGERTMTIKLSSGSNRPQTDQRGDGLTKLQAAYPNAVIVA